MNDPRAPLHELGLELPARSAAVADYLPAVRVGGLVTVSGQVPLVNGELTARGPVPSACPFDQARDAARQCVLNGLSAVDGLIDGSWAELGRVVRVGVFVASDPGFTEQHLVANAASGLLTAVFGDDGRHARAAVGVSALPLGASVEVEMSFALREMA